MAMRHLIVIEYVVFDVLGVFAPVAALEAADTEEDAADQEQEEQKVGKEDAWVCVVHLSFLSHVGQVGYLRPIGNRPTDGAW
jgi:hypothetical protein